MARPPFHIKDSPRADLQRRLRGQQAEGQYRDPELTEQSGEAGGVP
nr:hypothetical protein [Streptomyces luteolifulvus]